ncbi:OLC1v1034061C1 [Oldenlandia corymbosa var. corymbosa]|uniref:U-box domain-containing protein n=1 Tax=Oldenlandia corymbosa var. corymbosa TaxID=529605 RepID=A0AAV1CSH6_OLDCO|nr:OLC1v1034061C1 [Oldenlandia corymbosa var. corymbosa]
MDNVEVPDYFICPISLQIMKDPVTAATGITYDRESIEHWLLMRHNTICPVTKQPLPRDSGLTPNHNLLRLIQSWRRSTGNSPGAAAQMDKRKTQETSLNQSHIDKLIRGIGNPDSQLKSLQKLEALAIENEPRRKQLVEFGVHNAALHFIMQCHRGKNTNASGLPEALHVLYLIRNSSNGLKLSQMEDVIGEIIEAFSWVLGCDGETLNKTHAIFAMKMVVRKAKSAQLRMLKPEFFQKLVDYVKQRGNKQGINAALQVMLDSSPWGRNRIMLVEAGAPFELIELELKSPEKKTTELILGILFHLCSCADGRAQFLSHAAGVAMVSRRILKVSPAADDRAMLILSLISKFSGTNGVLLEMLRVGAAAKLCLVIQSNRESHLKDKAREILRTHSNAWKASPECLNLPTLTSDDVC